MTLLRGGPWFKAEPHVSILLFSDYEVVQPVCWTVKILYDPLLLQLYQCLSQLGSLRRVGLLGIAPQESRLAGAEYGIL